MPWQLDIHPKVLKSLNKFPQKDSFKIQAVIKAIPENPFAGDVLKMNNQDLWRRRVGSYRLFFEINLSRKSIFIFHVERRTSKTY